MSKSTANLKGTKEKLKAAASLGGDNIASVIASKEQKHFVEEIIASFKNILPPDLYGPFRVLLQEKFQDPVARLKALELVYWAKILADLKNSTKPSAPLNTAINNYRMLVESVAAIDRGGKGDETVLDLIKKYLDGKEETG